MDSPAHARNNSGGWSSRPHDARLPLTKGHRTRKFESAREQVVSTCLALLDCGYLKATEGNVSVRVPAEDAFAITPSNYDYTKMKPADICVLGHDLEKIEGSRKVSIEAGVHAAVYARRPDVNAIVKTHQPYASALALVRKPIPALFDEQVRFLGRSVPIIDYAPSGTSFLKKNVDAAVGSGANAFILANHGVLVLGGDSERAVVNVALLEKVALEYLLALMIGEKVRRVPAPIREIASGIDGKSGERAYIGDTLSANPLSCAAGYFAITEMERTNAPVLAGMAGDRLTAGLNAIIRRYSLPFVAFNQGSIVHLETSGVMLLDLKHPLRLAKELKPRKHMIEEMGAAYTANGLITLADSRACSRSSRASRSGRPPARRGPQKRRPAPG